ncbi:helix-turn-helix domain-containing protein [Pseudomonas aeruginosa]|uniref:helix-turn-helix domain-containing protein n=1 Tax=Pseudomonas aeruginosa TaxID=287 RepID=UPI001F08ECDB|nr:helix-turn-helix domain-containing protein [Pseudomonas aeruginosa]
MSPAQKAVLISLADQANDQGVCWPAVDSIATRCCLSKRAVQQAIKWLRSVGIVSIEERQGRSTMYSVTPAAYAPPQEMHPSSKCTRAGNAPHPRSICTQNRNRTYKGTIREPFAGRFRPARCGA